MGLNEGHIITYGKDEIETWPDWYVAAFGGKGMEPENITEGQRMMNGVFVLKNGQPFRGCIFAKIEKGNST